ncbi:M15 family metallopeptidase [Candidatus Wolfebacteria bacterium]|nr:M15 family metallopeptidase [Candidatus Wolfebacteria bacterium]
MRKLSQDTQFAVLGAVIVLGALGYVIYDLSADRTALQSRARELEGKLAETEEMLAESEEEGRQLAEALEAEQERLRDLGEQVEEITGTVGNLEKLAELAPELLQKYSKVYFLNEHFAPERLTDIDAEFLYDESREEQVDRRVWPFLEDLLEDARRDGVELYVVSGYRSFGTQAAVKSNYVVQYGSGANTFSAEQGYSEHQLGTTADFITTGIGGTLSGFENTEAYDWLLENAHKHGFTLSYPEGNAFYIFEPWHWRFVGRDLARDLDRKNLHFYDLPQTEIDTYLLEIFD